MNDSSNTPGRSTLPADHRVQLYTQILHVAVVFAVVVAATVLALRSDIRSSDVTTLYGAALGYAGGAAAAGTRSRQRADDTRDRDQG